MKHKILIIGPSWVGDMVMAQSLLRSLFTLNKQVQIDVLSSSVCLPLTQRMPEVCNSLEVNLAHGQWGGRVRKQFGKSLIAKCYDQAIILPNSWKSALIPFWAKIPVRTAWRGEMRYGLINDMRILDKKAIPKMVDRYRALAFSKEHFMTAMEALNVKDVWPRLVADTANLSTLNSKFSLSALSKEKTLGLCPGAEFGPAKMWPIEHYLALAEHYLDQGWNIFLFGSPKEQQLAKTFQEKIKHDKIYDFIGKTSLGDAIDLMSLCQAVVANDSGLMHIAAALNKVVIGIYGASPHQFTPPLSNKATQLYSNIDCRPCAKRTCRYQHYNCLKQITVNQVSDELESQLEKECST